jgi:methionyl-tRNA formyltransferase
MGEGVDTGPIEAQDFCHILPGETPAELWRRALAPLGLKLLTEAVARLAAGKAPQMALQDERVATFEPSFNVPKLDEDEAGNHRESVSKTARGKPAKSRAFPASKTRKNGVTRSKVS